MADNVPFTPGTGATGATDDIGGVHYPRVKPSLGADGSAVDAVGGAGAVGAGVQRMTLASDDPAVTALQVMDDWDESDRAKVNPVVGQAGVAAGAGAVSANTLRVIVATDQPRISVDGGQAHVVKVAPAVTAGAYTANDCMGGEMTVTAAARVSGGGGFLTGITMIAEDDSANGWVADDVEVLIFDSNPAGTYTDNNALDGSALTDADAALLLGTVLLDTHVALGNVSMLKATNVNIPYLCSGSANLFAVAVNRGGKTPEATDAIQFTFHLVRD